MAVSIREFKARLSHYLAQVRAGHTLEISSHRKVIARVGPVADDKQQGVERLLSSGAAQWDGGKPAGAMIRLNDAEKSVSDMVLEDRR